MVKHLLGVFQNSANAPEEVCLKACKRSEAENRPSKEIFKSVLIFEGRGL